jgi:drug/metabolite transporter (DMT)-like permease
MTKFLLAALLCLIWGSTWLAIKIGLEDSPPFLSAGFRFVIACLILFALIRWKKLTLAAGRKEWKNIIIPGFFAYFVSYGCVYWGEQHIGSGLAAVLFSTLPFWVALYAHYLLPDEKFNRIKLFSLIIGFSGILLIFWDNLQVSTSGKNILGMVALLGSAASGGFAGVRTKRDLHYIDPIVISASQMLVGMILLLIVGFLFEDLHRFKITYKSIGALLYLALFGSALAFSIYFGLLMTTAATKLSLIAFVTPVVALILGWAVLSEKISLRLVFGSALVITGIVLLVFWGKESVPLED